MANKFQQNRADQHGNIKDIHAAQDNNSQQDYMGTGSRVSTAWFMKCNIQHEQQHPNKFKPQTHNSIASNKHSSYNHNITTNQHHLFMRNLGRF